MRGKHRVVVYNRRVHFTLDLERNITVIRGDSATGKTTMLGMLRDYEEQGVQSGVTVQCDKPCRILTSRDWENQLERVKNSIVFVDEGNSFVSSQAFAQMICGSSNYYVLITRESLYQLPYSVEAVLELKTTTRREKRTYNKAYPYYGVLEHGKDEIDQSDCILTGDSGSGYQMFSKIAEQHHVRCDSAGGKSNIFACLGKSADRKTLVIADGAAFGAEMEKIYRLLELHPTRATLYLPESFEWLLLKSGLIRDTELMNILGAPEEYIDSEKYFSWEQYFADLLIRLTSERDYMRYSKDKLAPFYLQADNVQKVINAMETK